MPKQTKLDLAREYVTRYPRHSQREVARILQAEHPHTWPSWESVYMCVRRVCGGATTSGHENARHKPPPSYQKQKIASGTSIPALPKSKASDWKPYKLDGKRILVLSDVHVPYHDTTALSLALKWGKSRNADTVFLNGDIADFYSISRFETNPEERDFPGELDSVRQFLRYVRTQFPKARIVYKLGNHEERWWHWMWRKAPELMGCDFMDFTTMTGCNDLGIQVVSDQRIVMVGKLPVLHGHEWRAGISTPVNPARGAFLKAIECAMQGHLHRTSEHTETSLLNKTITCWSTGCLCDLHPEYARVNRWNHGFAEIEMHNGDFAVENKRILHGKVF